MQAGGYQPSAAARPPALISTAVKTKLHVRASEAGAQEQPACARSGW